MIKRLLSAAALVGALLFSPLSMAAEAVDINVATAAEIATSLNGVGPAKAQAIVDYREANGPFVSVDQLADVKGIGAATIEKNRTQIIIEPR
ncbi:ComEA family DNA-binding protein [Marinobacterium sp. MBR-109]|jgi:competence protein ComEA|uniref:ComEA family DNA-binding protein n=1 Tax=Marinobacterium sp. MBR-109 TaxID=3156462 RepID=UPI003397DF22